MIADPPLEDGALKATVNCALPGVTVVMVGAPGTPAGVTELEDEELGPLPTAFVALTVKVYA